VKAGTKQPVEGRYEATGELRHRETGRALAQHKRWALSQSDLMRAGGDPGDNLNV
jgi:hypothetical protein